MSSDTFILMSMTYACKQKTNKSISDKYNAPSVDRFSLTIKKWKGSWYFNKNIYSLTSDWWKYNKSRLKKNAKTFSKNSTTQNNI